MSAEVKGLPLVIKFEDIQPGDRIREVWHGITAELTAGEHLGHKVRIEGGNAVLLPHPDAVLYLLSRKAPEEPKGLGAVVEAHTVTNETRRLFVRDGTPQEPWYCSGWVVSLEWDRLVNPEVKSEGWVES